MYFHQVSNTRGDVFNAYIYHFAQWKPHFHKAYEWIHQLQGESIVYLGSQCHILKKGESLLIPPYGLHQIQSESENDCFIVVFSAQYVQSANALFSGHAPEHFKMRLSKEAEAYLMQHLIGPFPCAAPMHPVPKPAAMTLKTCLYMIFSEFIAQNPLHPKKSNDDIMERLLTYIENHYTDNITLAQAAEALGYQYDYLSRLFNQTCHMNFKATVNQYRCEKATQLLATTRKSLTDISMASGFQSIRSFNRIFRETMGMAPSDFRLNSRAAGRNP